MTKKRNACFSRVRKARRVSEATELEPFGTPDMGMN